MSYTFDGPNRLCILGAGVTTLDVLEMYSRWKDWAGSGDNSKFLPFLSVIGGDQTVGANAIALYFFVLNGWRIRPQEASHTLTVHGILNAEGGGELFADTIGNWRVRIVQIVPLQAETISVSAEGGAVGGGVPTASQVAEAVWSTANIKRLLGLILGLR